MSPFSLHNLPPTAALLVLASLLTHPHQAHALHALPRATAATTTLPYHDLDVVPWPFPFPTPAPALPGSHDGDVLRRQQFNTICGFIGGNEDLPATCSLGSHCVLAPEQGAIGCCPDSGPCTTGVFTGCVDVNSPPQTEVNPYIFTCAGADVCYQNVFDGGFSQFGCGTASELATTVRSAASSATLHLTEVTIPFTDRIRTLTVPTTIGSPMMSSSSWSSSSSSSSRSTTRSVTSIRRTTTSSMTTSSSPTPSRNATMTTSSTTAAASPTDAPPADGSGVGADKSAAIIGGVISGVAILVAIFIVAFTLWRRRSGNQRDGPGNRGSTFIPPTGGHGFTPVQPHEERFEPSHPPPMSYRYEDMPYGPRGDGAAAAGVAVPGAAFGSPFHDNHSPPQPGALGGSGRFESDRDPLNRAGTGVTVDSEMEEFRQGYRQAMEHMEHDEDPRPQPTAGTSAERPLWQQNRRLSRSLMWI